jgi:hypothetical protein
MKKLFTVLFLTSLTTLSYSKSKDSLSFKRFTVTTNLVDYVPTMLNTSCINIGTEVYVKNKKSIGLSIGYIKSNGPSSGYLQLSALSTTGMKVQLEGKHYFNRRKIFTPALFVFWPHIFQFKSQDLQNTGYYVAANVSYQNTQTKRQETIVDYIDDVPYANHTHYKANVYKVDRNVYALNIKIGYNCIKKRGFTIDHAVGLGAQYISSSSKNRMGNDTDWPNSERDIYGKKMFDNGSGIYPSFIYQIKLGWAF